MFVPTGASACSAGGPSRDHFSIRFPFRGAARINMAANLASHERVGSPDVKETGAVNGTPSKCVENNHVPSRELNVCGRMSVAASPRDGLNARSCIGYLSRCN